MRVRECSCVRFHVIVSSKPSAAAALNFVHDVEDTGQQYFVVKGKLQINYFHVNASRPEPLAVATSTFAAV